MKEFFAEKIETYFKGNYIGATCHTILCEEKEAQNKEITVTWNNVRELSQKYSELLNFYIVSYRKGMAISLNKKPKWTKEPKQWIDSEPNIVIKLSYKKKEKVSFNEIFNWYNADETAEYLEQHYPFLTANRVVSAYRANKEIVNNV